MKKCEKIAILILCLSLISCKISEEKHNEELALTDHPTDEQLIESDNEETIANLENTIKNLKEIISECESTKKNVHDFKISIREAEIQYLRGIKIAQGDRSLFLYPDKNAEIIGELSDSRIRVISTFVVETQTWILIELLEESYVGINSYGYIIDDNIIDVEDEEIIISDSINIGGVRIGDTREQVIAKFGNGYAEQVGRGGNLLFYFDEEVEEKDKYTWKSGKPKYIDISHGVAFFFDNTTRKVNKMTCDIESVKLLDAYYINENAEFIISYMDLTYKHLDENSYMYDVGADYYVQLTVNENKIHSFTVGNSNKLE